MKTKNTKKIFYINGYRGENSTKGDDLAKVIGYDIISLGIDWDNFSKKDERDIYKKVKDADLIIASSTGAYFARRVCMKHNIPLISLNPVIDLKKTLTEIGAKNIPDIKTYDGGLIEMTLVNKDDELIDYKETLAKFYHVITYEKGGHRFTNLHEAREDILSFINYSLI